MHLSEYYITSLAHACTIVFLFFFINTSLGCGKVCSTLLLASKYVRETRRDNPGIYNPKLQATSVTRQLTTQYIKLNT